MLKRLGFVLLAASLTCLPLALGGASWGSAPIWFALPEALLRAIAYGLFASVFGFIAILGGRNRPGGALRPAVIIAIVTGLLLSVMMMRAGV